MKEQQHLNNDKEAMMQHYKAQREARQRQRQQAQLKTRLLAVAGLVFVVVLFFSLKGCTGQAPSAEAKGGVVSDEKLQPDAPVTVGNVQFKAGYSAELAADTATIPADAITSTYAIVLDPATNTIIAQKDAQTTISPASMTKILTILVAMEQIEKNELLSLDDTFTITREITDYSYQNKCSAAGFLDEETVTVRDLFYGTILPSGADAAVGLATYVAGSHEAFVELMNQKLDALGLADTAHFTNAVGLYDELHYCTPYDMAMILKATLENDFCREVLSAHTYVTSQTTQHPEGITLSNWFLRRIEDKDSGGTVLAAKTGFVNQSGNCAASYAISNSGKPYICVTANSYHSWRCIYDHVTLYSTYGK